MKPKWSGSLISKMHVYEITLDDVSAKAKIAKTYVCAILNGKRVSITAREKIENAINELVEERKYEADTSTSES